MTGMIFYMEVQMKGNNRKALGAKLTASLSGLSEEIYNAHNRYAGSTSVDEAVMDAVNRRCGQLRVKHAEVQELAKKYLALAPEMESQFRRDVRELESGIDEFQNSVADVYHDTRTRRRVENDPLRPTGGGFARRVEPNRLVKVYDRVVPRIHMVPGLLWDTPVYAGDAHQRVIETFDGRGHGESIEIYDHDTHRRRVWHSGR